MSPPLPSSPSPPAPVRASKLLAVHRRTATKECAIAALRANNRLAPDTPMHLRPRRESNSSFLPASSAAAVCQSALHPRCPPEPPARAPTEPAGSVRAEHIATFCVANSWRPPNSHGQRRSSRSLLHRAALRYITTRATRFALFAACFTFSGLTAGSKFPHMNLEGSVAHRARGSRKHTATKAPKARR